MTTSLTDVVNADVIMATSNWAECHPVSYRYEGQGTGAKIIHVDPRFTRTSATADYWVPIRSGTNIVFFGGLISYAIERGSYFHDYVAHYTNGAFLMDPGFKTPADLDGLFSGFDPDKRVYDESTWRYQLDREGHPRRDMTLQRSEHGVPASAQALPPLHAGHGRARLRDSPGQVRAGSGRVLLRLGS